MGGGGGESVGDSSSLSSLLLDHLALHSFPLFQQTVPLLAKVVNLLIPGLEGGFEKLAFVEEVGQFCSVSGGLSRAKFSVR